MVLRAANHTTCSGSHPHVGIRCCPKVAALQSLAYLRSRSKAAALRGFAYTILPEIQAALCHASNGPLGLHTLKKTGVAAMTMKDSDRVTRRSSIRLLGALAPVFGLST
jgi:hypothetical protein